MSYIITEEIITHQIHTCSKCNKAFRFYLESEKYISECLSKHTKECDCMHSWTAWKTANLGTWPDYEPYTTRYCEKCNKKEIM